jgi:Flp pilus assembly pilin Flp
MQTIARLISSDDGQDLIEYGLLAGFISIICVALISSIGGTVNSWYEGYNTVIATIPSGTSGS